MREVERRGILIVEDDGGIRDALAELLAEEGYSVAGASNGREAVERLRQLEAVPGLVIVDLMMPVMDGREFCSELRRDPELSGITLVVISADARMGARAGDLEADAYLTKPLDLNALLTTIEAHVPSP